MDKRNNTQIATYFHDTDLLKNMRIDLLRACIMSLILVIVSIVFILYARNQDGGLNIPIFFISGLGGLSIMLYRPGRPAQFNRKTFGVPKEYTEYEKKLEVVILHLRNRKIATLATMPYFVWLLYLMATNEFTVRNDFTTLFLSAFFSFFMTLMLTAGVQYLQIWWALGKKK